MPDQTVLALATDAFGGYGGIAQYNRDIVSALARQDAIRKIDVAVRIAPSPIEELPDKVVQHKARLSRILYALECLKLSIISRPHIIFNAHLYHSPLAVQLAKLTKSKLVSQLHGTEIWGDINPRHLTALSHSDLVLCVSRDTEARILAACPDIEGKTFVLPNMVQPHFTSGDRAAARKKFLIEDEKVILTVARLDGRKGYKGHDRIIRQMPELLREHQGKIRYLIAGIGEDRPRLEALSKEVGVASSVTFLGKVSFDDLPDLYRAADVFAMPSTGEGFGIVYLEAMACGTPAIGLNVGGVRDAFAGISPGWCVGQAEFPKSLAEALKTPTPSRADLSQRIHARFGKEAFSLRLNCAIDVLGK